jgi:outer membrane PBP1 activator LpoA protein
MVIKKIKMTKLLIVILVAIFFTSCTVSKNATHKSDNANIVIPVQDHYSINGQDYAEYWRNLNSAKLTAW